MSTSASDADNRAARVLGAAYGVLQPAIRERAFPGCAFAILAGKEVTLHAGVGRFTYENDAREVGPETVFDVASLTKVVATTAAAMLLFQRGQLDLDTLLGDLLPGFVAARDLADPARRVRIRHLLAHSSGLPGYVAIFRTVKTPEELLQACLQLPLEAEPGSHAEYSDPGFILLGKALETLTSEDLASWVRREIFAPLGMAATGFCPAPELRASIPPTEIDTNFRHRRIQGEVQDENAWIMNGVAGHAGLFSNAPDLLHFARGILEVREKGAAMAGASSLYKRDTVERFAQRQGPAGSSRALGWDTTSENSSAGTHFSSRSIGHLGFSGCSLWIDLDVAVAVVLLTNRTWPDRQSQLIRAIRPAFHDAIREAL